MDPLARATLLKLVTGKAFPSQLPATVNSTSGGSQIATVTSKTIETQTNAVNNINTETSQGGPNDDASTDALEDDELRVQFGTVLDAADLAFSGNFYHASILTQAPNPCLQISGLGLVGLPLSERDAETVISCATLAPFGKGERTVVDKDVRDTWEIEPAKITFANSEWETYINGHVCQEACRSLGVEYGNSPPRMEFYKLLLYEQGSHFLPHQDTQKARGMFATVIIILPSMYTGGEVHVSHANSTKVLDFAPNSLLSTALLAWYTDVKHEVKPVTSGYRLALSYNLIHVAPPGVPKPTLPAEDDTAARLRQVLTKWREGDFAVLPETPFLAYILDHEYSETNLKGGADSLKGADAYKVRLLREIADDLDFQVGLGRLELCVSGPAEDEGYDYYSRRRHNYYDDGDMYGGTHSMMEETSRTTSISGLVDLQGNSWLASHQSIELSDENLVQDEPFEDEAPDDTDYEGYQGNYAGDVSEWYRRSVLVVAHKDDLDAICFVAGGLTYAFQKLKTLGIEQEDVPVTEELRQWITRVLSKVNQMSASQALQIINLAIRWKDVQTFETIIKAPSCNLNVCGSDMLLKAWKAFSFEVVRPSFDTLLARSISLADKFKLIFATVRPNMPPEEREIVLTWSNKACAKMLSSFSNPDPAAVPTIMAIIRTVGLGNVRKLMIPDIFKQTNTYTFLIAFVKALREGRQGILDGLSRTAHPPISVSTPQDQASSNTVNSTSVGTLNISNGTNAVDDLITECLSKASTQWSQAASAYSAYNGYSYISSYQNLFVPQTQKIDRIIEILEQALVSNNTDACKALFVDILKTGTSAEQFAQTHTPLIPRLKALLSGHNRELSSPFLDFFQILIATYFRDVLGSKGQPSTARLRKIGCGCPECNKLDVFIMNPRSTTETFRYVQKIRNHLETRLATAPDLCTYDTIRYGSPHRLEVKKLPAVIQASMWEPRQKEAVAFLFSIGNDDVIKKIMGGRYPDVAAALSGVAPFGSTLPAPGLRTTSNPVSVAGVHPQNAVVGQKRKGFQ
ncbi:hypothetical protein CPB83DRAFT_909165 [Crepidotus variabilis]|uniref:Fe2OG dioxygenase domain-containing protein n=1 Tax=Crepidotus variabilis TaxID=179855 RepID=A0A9P6EAC9_9AGAR|nr:hypothetical protein CPB83DRAFT_909165 [Crepidotus variabilis]